MNHNTPTSVFDCSQCCWLLKFSLFPIYRDWMTQILIAAEPSSGVFFVWGQHQTDSDQFSLDSKSFVFWSQWQWFALTMLWTIVTVVNRLPFIFFKTISVVLRSILSLTLINFLLVLIQMGWTLVSRTLTQTFLSVVHLQNQNRYFVARCICCKLICWYRVFGQYTRPTIPKDHCNIQTN